MLDFGVSPHRNDRVLQIFFQYFPIKTIYRNDMLLFLKNLNTLVVYIECKVFDEIMFLFLFWFDEVGISVGVEPNGDGDVDSAFEFIITGHNNKYSELKFLREKKKIRKIRRIVAPVNEFLIPIHLSRCVSLSWSLVHLALGIRLYFYLLSFNGWLFAQYA